jgi:hypothetical protein
MVDMTLYQGPVHGMVVDPIPFKATRNDGDSVAVSRQTSLWTGTRLKTTLAVTSVLLALTTASHAQSRLGAVWPTELRGPPGSIARQPVPIPDARQVVAKNSAHGAGSDTRYSRDSNSELQQLYDEIMRRVGVSYKDPR